MNNSTIGSLITIPDVETVIRLDAVDSEDLQTSQELLSSFVVTDQIENALRQFLKQVVNKQGTAAFLRGNYGSGKSHFLAVLAILLESSSLWRYLQHSILREFDSLAKQKIMVVKIALHNFAADESLESILFGETEKEIFHKSDKAVLLRRDVVLLEHFNRYVVPQHPEFLQEFKKSMSDWQKMCRHKPELAVQMAYTFVTQKHIPLRPLFDRREALNSLYKVLSEENYTGVFWVLDELSEFLKAKDSPSSFTEDLRFLQFLGEACTGDTEGKTHQPIYLFAALQENIEKTGYIEKDLIHRIKDRFPLRFSLSAQHVNQLIARRLIHKEDAKIPKIRQIYEDFITSFPQAQIDEKTFCDIYPVHPDTVQLLEGLTPIFSQHRGVVDFIYHQLRGDVNRDWPGMLHLPADQLMTADTIFDHFRERLREIPDFSPYVDVVYLTLEQDSKHIFTASKDQTIALMVVKILILIELNLIEKHITVKHLAQMLNQPLSDLDQSLNYTYLEEVILDKLVRESSFIVKEQLESGDTGYAISMEMTVHQMVRNRVKDHFIQPDEIERELPRLFSYLSHSQLPLALLSTSKRRTYGFVWQNTNREGWIIYKSQPQFEMEEWEEINRDVKTSEKDFVLFIFGGSKTIWPNPPVFMKGLFEGAVSQVILAWIPRPFTTTEMEFLCQFYAYEAVHRELSGRVDTQDKQMRQIVHEWLESHQQEFVSIVDDSYLQGRIADSNGWRDGKLASFYPNFKSILKQIFSPVLQAAFPKHSEIMPGDIIQPFIIEKLYMHLIKPGCLSKEDARAQNIDRLIETSVQPLGICEFSEGQYCITLSATSNELVKKIMDDCTGDKPENLYSLYWRWRKSEWGLMTPSFQLIIASLLATGRFTAFQTGNVVSFRTVTQLNDGSIDAIGAGKLVSEVVQQAILPFLKLNSFQGITPHFSVSSQEQIWRSMKDFRSVLQNMMQKWQMMVQRYETYPALKLIVNQADLDLVLLNEFCQQIRTSFPARQGLERIVEQLGSSNIQRVPDQFVTLKNTTSVVENRLVELNQVYIYLEHPNFTKITASLADDLVKEAEEIKYAFHHQQCNDENVINEFVQQFYQFRSNYTQIYTELHKQYYLHDAFSQVKTIESEPLIQVLKRMHKLEAVVCSPDWISIQETVSSFPRSCNRSIEIQLVHTPVCECGFIPEQSEPEIPISQLHQMAIEGVQSGLHQLQHNYRWILEDYSVKLQQVGKSDIANILNSLLKFNLKHVEYHTRELLSLLSDDMVGEINGAIRGKVLIVQRQFKQLYKRLFGKQLPIRDVRKILDDWLTGGESIPEDAYIQIVSEKDVPEFDPKRYHLFQHVVREDGARFFQACYLLAWVLIHEKKTWLEWLKNKYRFKHIDSDTVKKIRLFSFEPKEIERIADYFQRSGMFDQMIQLIEAQQMELPELTQFILRETFWEALSIQATRSLLLKVALTESVPHIVKEFYHELKTQSRTTQWPHLHLLMKICVVLDLITDWEHVENSVAFYLKKGWQLPGSIDAITYENRIHHLLTEDRIQTLQQRFDSLKQRFYFPQKRFSKKELPLPYWTIQTMPSRIRQEVQADGLLPIVFIVDAMRWDVWQMLLPFFKQWLSPRNMIFESAMEVASPTTTEVNRQIVIERMIETTRATDWHLETVAERPSHSKEIVQQIKKQERLQFLNTTIVDTLLHEREEPIDSMLEVMKTRMETLIRPLFIQIPENFSMIITSDHGFTKIKKAYSHGGDSFFEKIVPFTIWKKSDSGTMNDE